MKTFYSIILQVILLLAGSELTSAQWQPSDPILEGVSVWFMVDQGSDVLAATQNGVYRSQDDGNSWTLFALSGYDVYFLMVHGSDLYASTWGQGLLRSGDGGATWTVLNSGLSSSYIVSTAFPGSDLWVCADDGLFRSADNGQTFTEVLVGTSSGVNYLYGDASQLLASAYDGLYRSTDNGLTWSLVPTISGINVWQVASFGSGLFASTSGNGLMASWDGGINWSPVSGLTQPYINYLYSVENKFFVGTEGGLFASNDGINFWDLNAGFDGILSAWTLQKAGGNLLTGGFSSGMWIRPLSDLDPAGLTKDASNIGFHHATLKGVFRAGGTLSSIGFAYGTDPGLGMAGVPTPATASGYERVDAQTTLFNLDSAQTYFYAAFVMDGADTLFGQVQAFSTDLGVNDMYAYYPLDCDPGDFSGHDYHGIWQGAACVDGVFEGAYRFSGSEPDYVLVENMPSLTQDFSVAVWVKPENISSTTLFDVFERIENFSLYLYGDRVEGMLFESWVNMAFLSAPVVSNNGEYVHLAMVYDYFNHSLKIYHNGQLAGETYCNVQVPLTNEPLAIGVFSPGVLDDVRFYDRVLAPAEVAQLYSSAILTHLTATDETCAGCADGSLDLTFSGGIGPYSILWNIGATTEDISGLSAGEYRVTVTDAVGHEGTESGVINGSLFGGANTLFLEGVGRASLGWADFDLDEDLDLLVTGLNSAGSTNPNDPYLTELYINNGDGTFSPDTLNQFAGVEVGSVNWADYDNDGYPDLLMTGGNYWLGDFTKLYHNNGNGTFSEVATSFLAGANGGADWGDFNNDGFADLVITGSHYDYYYGRHTSLYRNNKDGSFTEVGGTGIPGTVTGGIKWADYDQDGNLDLLIVGEDTNWENISRIYKGDGMGGFVWQENIEIPGFYYSSSAWCDYDNDSFPDFLLTGASNVSYSPDCRLYHNNGDGTFSQSPVAFPGIQSGSGVFGDLNNDGWSDIVLVGSSNQGIVTRIFLNSGNGSFSENGVSQSGGIMNGAAALGDFDQDGSLDLALCGNYPNSDSEVLVLFPNSNLNPNIPPSPPTSGGYVLNGQSVQLHWGPGGDDHTPSPGLTYNLRLGTTPGGMDGLAPLSNLASGYRRIPGDGNVGTGLSANLHNLLPGTTYYYAIQTVDPSFRGGSFSQEGQFTTTFAPSVQTLEATDVSSAAVNLRGTVEGWGLETTIWFEYGPDPSYGSVISGDPGFVTIPGSQSIVANLTGLVPNSTYHYRVVAQNADGISFGSDQAFFVPIFLQTSSGLQQLALGSTDWGDIDNDGDLDLLITGGSGSYYNSVSCLYLNSGTGGFTLLEGFPLEGLAFSAAAFGDFNNDGLVDIAVTGRTSSGNYLTKLLQNMGGNLFSPVTTNFVAFAYGDIQWIDFNNDGFSDLLVSGYSQSHKTCLYKNNGDGTFTDQTQVAIPEFLYSSMAVSDFDKDGLMDFVISGELGYPSYNGATYLYRNTGNGNFSQVSVSLPGMEAGSISWGDQNNDGFPDLLLNGWYYDGAWNNYLSGTMIFLNDGAGSFYELSGTGFYGSAGDYSKAQSTFVDYDNDGWLDVALIGINDSPPDFGYTSTFALYHNNADGSYSRLYTPEVPQLNDGTMAWADVDGDGDQDFVLAGYQYGNSWDYESVSMVFENFLNIPNAPPDAPTGLTAFQDGTDLLLTWNPSTDAETPAAGLSYNVRLATYSGGENLLSAMAEGATGVRKICLQGNASQDTFMLVKNVGLGTHFWSVQALDGNHQGSEFGPESSSFVQNCQALNYKIIRSSTYVGTYQDLGSSGSVILTTDADDSNSQPVDIGFPFSFNCQEFSQFILNTNGFIKLGNVAPTAALFPPATGNSGTLFASSDPVDMNLIAAFNMDLVGNSGAEYRVFTSGQAPNRICTIQFKDLTEKTTTPPVQIQSMEFQIRLFETSNVIEIVFGNWMPTSNTSAYKGAAMGLKGAVSSSAYFLSVGKNSGTAWSTVVFRESNYPSGNFGFNFGNPPNRPLPEIGRTYRFAPDPMNDARVVELYAMGKLPVPIGLPQTISGLIRNDGVENIYNLPVDLTISGANSYSETQIIPYLAPGDAVALDYSGFVPQSTGWIHVVLSVPNDDNNPGNSEFYPQLVNENTFAYSDTAPAGNYNWGYGTGTGLFMARYTCHGTKTVHSVKACISNYDFNVGKTIYGVVLNAQGILVGESDPYVITSADKGQMVELVMPVPPLVNHEDFFVGIEQTPSGESYYPMVVQPENPTRLGAYYYGPAGGGVVYPYSSTAGIRFVIEGIVEEPVEPVAVASGTQFCAGDSISVSFTSLLPIEPGNVYSLELSDGAGSFANPVVLSSGLASPLTGLIPPETLGGNAFRVRVNASLPYTVGINNGVDITIQNPLTQVVIANGQSYLGLVGSNSPTCSGFPLELYGPEILGGTFAWAGPGGYSSMVQNPVIDPASPDNTGEYTLVVTQNGCASIPLETFVVVSDISAPVIVASTNQICLGDSALLSAQLLPLFSYQWQLNGVDIPDGTGEQFYAKSTGDYSLNLLANCGVLASAPVFVSVTDPTGGYVSALSGGLIAYYPLDGNAQDQSGHGFHAGYNNCISTTDRSNQADHAFYSEYGRYMDFGALPGSGLGGELTVAVWANPASFNEHGGIVTKGSGGYEVFSLLTRTDQRFHFTANWPGTWFDLPTNPHPTGQWYFLTAVFDHGQVSIYVDGVLENVGNWGMSALSDSPDAWLSAGVNQPGGWEYFSGSFDDIRLYNRALNMAEIQQLYQSNGLVAQQVDPVCLGQTIQLIALEVPGANYSWTGPGGFSSNLQNPVIPDAGFEQAGLYYLELQNQGCSLAPVSVVVEVVGPPVVDLGNDQNLCSGATLFLDAGSGGSYFQWSDGSTGQTLAVSQPGTIGVTVTDTHGCVNTDEISVMGWPSVQILMPDTALVPCTENQLILSPQGQFQSFHWNTGSWDNSIVVTGTGIYQVTVSDANGCLATAQTVVSLIPPSPVDTLWVCQGGTANINLPDSVFSIVSSTEVLASPVYSPGWEQPGFNAATWNPAVYSGCTQVVEGSQRIWCNPYGSNAYFRTTFPLFGLPDTALMRITADDAFNLYINGSYVGGGGSWGTIYYFDILPFLVSGDNLIAVSASNSYDCYQLTFRADFGAGGFYSYLWSTGETTRDISVSPLQDTTYSLVMSDGLQSCTRLFHVEVEGLPQLSLPDTVLLPCGSPGYLLDPGSGYFSYQWNNGSVEPSIQVNASGHYFVTVSNAYGCTSTDGVQVSLIPDVLADSMVICSGDTLFLEAGISFTPNLVAWFPFNGSAMDQSGHGNHGNPVGPELTVDRFGNANQAYLFDGSDYIVHPTTGLNGLHGTLSAWIKPNSYSWGGLWQTHDENGWNWNDWITVFDYYNPVYFRVGNGSSCCSNDLVYYSSDYIVPGEWTFLCFTWEGNTMKAYLNGTLIAARYDVSLQPQVDPLARIGWGHGLGFTGSLDEVALYNRALTSAEILQVYGGLNPQFSTIWSTGSTQSWLAVAPPQSANFSVTLTDGIQSCVENVWVAVNPLPEINFGDTLLIPCGTSSVILDPGSAFSAYEWSNEMTTQTIEVTGSCSMGLTVTDSNGCRNSDSLLVSLVPTVITPSQINLCGPSPVSLASSAYYPGLGANPPAFDLDGFEGGPGSSDDWFSRNGIDPVITDGTAYSGHYSLYMPVSWGGNFEDGNNIEPGQDQGFYTDQFPYMSMAYKIPPGAVINMLVHISGVGYRSITLTQGENPCSYPAVASWNAGTPLQTDGLWHFKTIDFREQIINALGPGNYFITGLIWHDGGCLQGLTGAFWIDDFMITPQVPADPVSSFSSVWSTGDPSALITVNPLETTTYYLTVTDQIQECVDSATVFVNEVPVSELPVWLSIPCEADQLVLDAGAGPGSYYWSEGATTHDMVVQHPGQFFVTITSPEGCSTIDSVSVTSAHAVIESINSSVCEGDTVVLGIQNQMVQGQDLANFSFVATLNGHLYYLSDYPATWWDARDACAMAGGHLVTISGPEENQLINDLPFGFKWLGFSDEAVEGAYQWVTGEAPSYTAWCGNEPNNSYGEEDFAISNWGNYCWNDVSGTSSYYFVLEFDLNPFVSVLWSNGETNPVISVAPLTSTAYSVTVTDGLTTCTDQIFVEVSPKPVLDLGPDVSVCGEMPVLLDAGNPGFDFLWNTGATTQTLLVMDDGWFEVTVSNPNCSESDGLSVGFFDPLAFNLGNDTTIYTGNTLILDPGPGAEFYLWASGETTQTLTVESPGQYSVTATNACGSFADEVQVSVINPAEINLNPDFLSFSIDYGNAGYGSFTLSNSGEDNLIFTITNIPGWIEIFQTQGVLASGESMVIIATVPSGPGGGNYYGALHIYSNDQVNPLVILPIDLVIFQASMVVSPGEINFGGVVKNTTASASVSLINTGNLSIQVNSVTTQAPFTAGAFDPFLPPSQTMVIPIEFTPTATLLYTKPLQIATSYGNFTVNLQGVGQNAAPAWAFSFTNYNFGYADVVSGTSVWLTIYNTGNVPVQVTGLSTSAPFSVSETAFDIPVGGNHQVQIGFQPTALNSYSGILSVSSNCGAQVITLAGAGMIMTTPPQLSYVDSLPYNGADGVSPTVGTNSAYFEYAVIYSDPDNLPPLPGYPKLGIDRNGDGDFLDSEEGWVSLAAEDASDLNFADGKKYVYATTLPISSYYGYAFQAYNQYANLAIGEATQYRYGPLVSNDLLDILIYANDITFSDNTPGVGQTVTINAVIHNYSDYPADLPFQVQFWKEDTLMGEQTVPYLAAQSDLTIQIDHVFTWDEFYPIKVILDVTDTLEEDNELNNFAIRPLVVGEFSVPGSISVSAQVSPQSSYHQIGSPPPLIHYQGHADYVGSFDPDTKVAGAEVTLTLIETGQSFTTFTNGNGDFDFYYYSQVPAAGDTAIYHAQSTVTDYTLTSTTGLAAWTVISEPPPPKKPDLNVYHWVYSCCWMPNIFWTDSCIMIHEPIDVAVYVWNSGDSVAYNARFFGYADNPTDTLFSVVYDSIFPGESRWEYFTVVFDTDGNHLVGIYADPDNEIEEHVESNNHASVNRMIYTEDVDLKPGYGANSGFWISDETPIEEQEVMIGMGVMNDLCNLAGESTGRLYDIFEGDTILIGSLDYPALNGFTESFQYVTNYSFTGEGDHQILGVVDYLNAVEENHEENNERTWYVHVGPKKPDLTFSAYPYYPLGYSLQVSATDVSPGDQINFSAVLKNDGTGEAENFTVRFYLDEIPIGSPVTVPVLWPGQVLTILSEPWTITPCGHELKVVLDEENLIDELKENNNTATREDVGVDNSVGGPGGSGWAGTPVVVGTTVWNYGTFEADSVVVSYYCLNCDPANSELLLGYDVIPHIPSEWFAFSHTVFTFEDAGTYHIRAYVDTTVFCEVQVQNNVANGYVYISEEKPDLMIHSYHISPTELNPDPGETIDLFSSFENTSNKPAGPFILHFEVDSNPVGDPILVPGLAAHSDTSVACSQSWSSTQIGPHIVRVILDDLNQVNESNELNNEASRAVIVGDAPDMKFSNIAGILLSNNLPQVGEWVTISSRIRNIGGDGGAADVSFYFVNGTDSSLIQTIHFALNDHDSVDLTLPWQALDHFGRIVGVISGCVPMEFNLFNNQKELVFGVPEVALSVNLVASSSSICGSGNAQLMAVPSGGTGTYTVTWTSEPPGLNFTGNELVVSPTETTTYFALIEDGYYTQTYSTTVAVSSTMAVSFAGLAGQFCDNHSPVTLTPSPSGGTFSGPGISGNVFDPGMAGEGIQSISYDFSNQNGCSGSVTNLTEVIKQPVFDLQTIPVSCNGLSDGSIDLTLNGAFVSLSFLWSTGSVSEDLLAVPSGVYQVTVTNENFCAQAGSIALEEPLPLAIGALVQPASGLTLPDGAIDVTLSGGVSPYLFTWSNGVTLEDNQGLMSGLYSLTVTDSHNCLIYLASPVGYTSSQILNLIQGWNVYSTYIIPGDPAIPAVFAPVMNDMVILKNGNGQVYWPQFQVNSVGDLQIGEGYQVKMSFPNNLTVSGTVVLPEHTPLNVPQGWSFLGYLRQNPAPLTTALGTILNRVVIMVNGYGQVYWPQFGVNQIINMIPGLGYKINLNAPATLVYPANSPNQLQKSTLPDQSQSCPRKLPTGNAMYVAIPDQIWKDPTCPLILSVGDELAVFGEDGLLVASSVYEGKNMVLVLWGDDESTPEKDGLGPSEKFVFRSLANSRRTDEKLIKEFPFEVEKWTLGGGTYQPDQLNIVGGWRKSVISQSGPTLMQNVPNPFSDQTAIGFELPFPSFVDLSVFNPIGEKVACLFTGNLPEGNYSYLLNGNDLAQGAYFYRLTTSQSSITLKLDLVK